MAKMQRSGISKVAHEIGHEAKRQVCPFPRELKRQLTQGWGRAIGKQLAPFGDELFRQIAGHRPRRRGW